jgi:hypothetical protein
MEKKVSPMICGKRQVEQIFQASTVAAAILMNFEDFNLKLSMGLSD